MKRSKKFVVAAVLAGVVAAAVPAVVVATIITNATAVAVKVTASLPSNSEVQFSGTSGPLAGLVTTCTKSSTSFTLASKATGLGPFTLSLPSFSNCTDNLGGTDTITSNNTNGPWTFTYVNSPGAPNPDTATIGAPMAGQTLTGTAQPGCTVTLDPSGPGTISGNYDNAGNLTFPSPGQTINYSAAGTCPISGTGTGTATFAVVLQPAKTGKAEYKVTSGAPFGTP